MDEMRRAVIGDEARGIARAGGAALGRRLQLRLDISAEIARMRDDRPPESAALLVVARERRIDIAARRRERIGEAGGIERRLAGAGGDMRPRDESRIAH